jgi:glyoxylase-like metal-dependent hydrolase (beta-lactamase superfamily II)
MNYLLSHLVSGAYVVAIEDTHTWDVKSYTNLYVLQRQGQTILIDAGMKEYQPVIIEALEKIGVTPDQVTHVLLTHGHRDHADGASIFVNAKKYVHAADRYLLGAHLASEFVPFSPLGSDLLLSADGVSGIEGIHVNTHTPGSVVLYDDLTKALFVGDFFCFFGEALPEGELVSYSDISRQGSCQYVADQAACGGEEFDRFMLGLGRLLSHQPEFFCTGHGVVLQGEIQSFINNLWKSGRKASDKV